jgi:hypothetical protein
MCKQFISSEKKRKKLILFYFIIFFFALIALYYCIKHLLRFTESSNVEMTLCFSKFFIFIIDTCSFMPINYFEKRRVEKKIAFQVLNVYCKETYLMTNPR